MTEKLPHRGDPIPITVEAPQPAGENTDGWGHGLEHELRIQIAALLAELRLPGRPQIQVATATTGSLLVRVHGVTLNVDSYLEAAIRQETGDTHANARFAKGIAQVTRAIIADRAATLVGPGQLTAWLGGHRPRSSTRNLLGIVVAGLVELGIAIPAADVLLPLVEDAAAAGLSDVEMVEQIFARVRPGVMEVRTAPSILDASDEAWLRPALVDAAWIRSGVRLPTVAFIEDKTLEPGTAALKINHVTGRPLFPATGDDSVWPAVARELYRLAYRLVGCLDVEYSMAQLRQTSPELIRLVLGRFRPEAVTKVLREIAREQSIADLSPILERLANFDVVVVGEPGLVVLDDRLAVWDTDRKKALADWRNQVTFARAS